MRRLALPVCFAALAALAALGGSCGDNQKVPPPDDPGDGSGSGALAACLDRPTELPRPPSAQLPCELLPPGFGAK